MKENISFGYNIHEVLINDIEPDPKVRQAMNEINTQLRLTLAKKEQANGYKLEIVSKAEANATAHEMEGRGIAASKTAVIKGFKMLFPELTDSELAQLIISSEQINIMKQLVNSGKSPSTIFVPFDNKMNFNLNLPSTSSQSSS